MNSHDVLPKDWDYHKLGDLCELIADGTHFSPQTKDGPFRYITSKNIKFGQMDLTDCEYISEEEHTGIYKGCPVKFGDLLLTKDGANTGNAAINILHEPFSLLSSVALIRGDRQKLLNEFLLQYILSPRGQSYLKNEMAGLAITRLTLTTINGLKIPLPPLAEQRKIADILGTWDEAITRTERLIKAKQRRKKALMQQLLTGKVRFGEFEGSAWREVRLGSIANTFSGGTPSRNRKEYYNGNIPWIKSGELHQAKIHSTAENISQLGLDNSSAKMVKTNTILVAMYGATAGVVAISEIEAAINQAILAIIPHNDVDYLYLYYSLTTLTSDLLRKVQGSGQPNLNASILKSSKIRLPLIEEQRRIAAVLQTCDAEIELLQQKLAALRRQKKGLMQQLLTGKVRVEG